jgi:putative membrane protein
VNRESQGVVLFLIGAALLWASFSDLYLRYVRAGLQPLLIGAGIVLIVASLTTFWYEFRATRARKDSEKGHSHREPGIAWLLVLPVFALILVAPPALGSYAANRTGTALQRPPGFPPLPAGDPLQLTVLDYATRAVFDNGHSLGTRRFTITGFITIDHAGNYVLTRMVLSCCAADALPIKVGLDGQVPAALKSDSWLEVTGVYTARHLKDEVNDAVIPFIEVRQAKPVPVPRFQYES